ncbi:S26 family signal peptidase [Halopiger xanaduensis]|nr:S26 family signal peptidase [Halopiger xanaduensis]
MSDRPPDESSTDAATDVDPTDADTGADSDETAADSSSVTADRFLRWLRRSDDPRSAVVRDVLSAVAIVSLVGLVLFAVSGVWPPLVAIESGSMEPNMNTGDLVFVVATDRFVGDESVADTGVVTLENGRESGYETFDRSGDVVVFRPDGNDSRTPVIHRAHFWVEAGENWVDTEAESANLRGTTCDAVAACPAPHDGFVTKGDNNGMYDQVTNAGAETTVVRPDWVVGKAAFRIPWLGRLRLVLESLLSQSIDIGVHRLTGPSPR